MCEKISFKHDLILKFWCNKVLWLLQLTKLHCIILTEHQQYFYILCYKRSLWRNTRCLYVILAISLHGQTFYRAGGSNFTLVRQNFMGQSYLYIKCKHHNCEGLYIVVRSTTSMRSMLLLGGSGGMPPQENFENSLLWDWIWEYFKL